MASRDMSLNRAFDRAAIGAGCLVVGVVIVRAAESQCDDVV
jgi:hypothetical protein